MSREELAQRYRDAARSIERGEHAWSCNAIASFGGDKRRYKEVFMPTVADINATCPRPNRDRWTSEHLCPDGSWGSFWGHSWKENENCRILALCLMAAMVEAGDA